MKEGEINEILIRCVAKFLANITKNILRLGGGAT